ncbi:hypothetical protein BLOT_012195 [Blomia tropicalis]|nr:hypothetical protein BLOT_012195 [Blomia tropicalis]
MASIVQKNDRNRLHNGIHLFFQLILSLTLLFLIINWTFLLTIAAQNIVFISTAKTTSSTSSSIKTESNINITNNSLFMVANDSLKILQITTIAIPELFAVIALMSVLLADIYGCTVSGLVLFVLWMNEHQQRPMLLGWNSVTNTIQALTIIGHALHLVTWCLLLAYGAILASERRIRDRQIVRAMLTPRSSCVELNPGSFCPYGNYCGYMPSTQSTTTSQRVATMSMSNVPPYYEHSPPLPPPPMPTFETIQIVYDDYIN